jgi:hypothetical protein
LSEAQVIEAKAKAREQEGLIEATIIEKKAVSEAAGISAKAVADHKQGMLQAEVMEKKALATARGTVEQGSAEAQALEQKLIAEAKGVEQKALAMKELDGVGREHEEFKLRLEKEKAIELANIDIQRYIAEAQAMALAEAFKHAKIDIVGGEQTFINNIMNAINRGQTVDRMINSSQNLSDLKQSLIGNGNGTNGIGNGLLSKILKLMSDSGISTNDVKNLTLSALLLKLQNQADDTDKGLVSGLLDQVKQLGISNYAVEGLL